MRLTLRNMLNYMDDVLEPADREEIGRKINESEFATRVMHTIRDVTRMMRLGAPQVLGRGMGFDPNTVAEYLDNEMPGERVPDFEKICLESNIQLAEVASCHQILSLVLGTAADIDPDLRAKMYAIGARADEPAEEVEEPRRRLAEPPPLGPAAAAFSAAGEARERPEVPEYLRSATRGGRRSRLWPVLITVALAASLLVAIISAAGPWDKTNPVIGPLLSALGGGAKPAEVAQGDDKKPSDRTPSSDTKKPETPDDHLKPDSGDKGAVEPAKPGDHADVTPADKGNAAGNAAPTVPAGNPADGIKTGQVSTVGGTVEKPADPLAPLPVPGPNDVPRDTPRPGVVQQNLPADKPAPPVANPDGPPVVAPPVANPPAPAAADVNAGKVGRLPNDNELLLTYDSAQKDWHKTSAGTTFSVGDRLLALPTFRPIINVSSGVTLQLQPETLIQFQAPVKGAPVVRLNFGRLTMLTTGNPGVKLGLDMGQASGVLVFEDAESIAAIEARPYHLAGENPETAKPRVSVVLYGVKGASLWTPTGGESVELKSPGGLVLAGDPAAYNGTEMPRWISGETISNLDVGAGQILSRALDEKRPLTQVLREMADPQTRRKEEKSLGARSLALVDEFEPLIRMLNDSDQRPVWPIQIKNLETAIARGPEVAAQVRVALEKRHGKEGADLYRMLWGYTKEQLSGGEAERLVAYLDRDDPDDLIFRVLAIHDLAAVTGGTQGYLPDAKVTSRQLVARKWKEMLKQGQIVPKVAAPAGKPATPATPMPDAP